jgi:plastocyanin
VRNHIRIPLVLALAAVAILAIPATSIGGKTRIRATSNRTWNPDFKGVKKGTKVIFKNPTNLTHNVTAYKGDWSKNTDISPGSKTSKVFRKNGAFYYRCRFHSTLVDGDCDGMCGHIHVSSG